MNTHIASRLTFSWHHVPNVNKANKILPVGIMIGQVLSGQLKLQLHDAIYRLRFYSNSLVHILSLSNSHSNVASIQKNRGDRSHRVIVA